MKIRLRDTYRTCIGDFVQVKRSEVAAIYAHYCGPHIIGYKVFPIDSVGDTEIQPDFFSDPKCKQYKNRDNAENYFMEINV